MKARPVIRAASGGVTRRRTQTMVIFLVLLVSTASATLSLALLADSNRPFQHAFAEQHGADVAITVDSARATNAQLVATGRLPGITQAAGPFPQASITLQSNGNPPQLVPVVGRRSQHAPLDDLTLQAGRWARRPGQIVLSSNLEILAGVGSMVTVSTAPGAPRLAVVGIAQSVTNSAGAWVVPAEVTALRAHRAPAEAQMLYRLASAGSAAQVRAGVAVVSAALPAGTILGTPASWLAAEKEASGPSSIISPFVVAFALIGLAMSVLIVSTVVSGAVVASYRRIGVLKSIGFTPAQVVAAYVARVGVPALPGCLIGVALGNLLAAPVLGKSANPFGVGQSVPLWVNVVTPLVMCTLAVLAALLPALRAGRLSAVAAIATGQAPRPGRGYAAHRLLGRLRLPRPVTIGLAAPFARPARTAGTLAAIMFGATAVIFAVGLTSSLAQAADGQQLTAPRQLQVWFPAGGQPHAPRGAQPPSAGSEEQAAAAAIRAQPGTLRYVAEATPAVGVSGLTQQVTTVAFEGNAAWTGYDMISGRWYRGPDTADVNTAFLTQTGLTVGDVASLTVGGRVVTVRIAGEVFDPAGQPALFASWQALGGAAAGLTVAQIDVGLRPGVSPDAYAGALSRRLGNGFGINVPGQGGHFYTIAVSLIGLLTLMMAVVAGLGVLNTVLLGTRDRVHDLGVFKAVGMTPRQTIAMVVCWIVGPAIAAAVIAVPAGTVLHSVTVQAMGNAASTGIPASFVHVYRPAEVALLGLAGLAIAVAGALPPATWAARARTAAALRAE